MRYPDFIEELLLKKEYSALSDAEKQQVNEWVANEEEYTKIRELLLGIEGVVSLQDEEDVPEHIKSNLERAFAKKYKAKRVLTLRWQLVATISIAASLALLFYVGSLFKQQQKPTEVAVKTPIEEEENKANPKTHNWENETKDSDKTVDTEEAKKPLPQPPIEIESIEDDVLEKYTVDEDIESDVAPETEKMPVRSLNEIVVVEPKEKNKVVTEETLNAPQMSFSSPPTPLKTDGGNYTVEGKVSLESVSLSGNTDLLDLGVPVY
jgi:cytoskeletal protein RodZ